MELQNTNWEIDMGKLDENRIQLGESLNFLKWKIPEIRNRLYYDWSSCQYAEQNMASILQDKNEIIQHIENFWCANESTKLWGRFLEIKTLQQHYCKHTTSNGTNPWLISEIKDQIREIVNEIQEVSSLLQEHIDAISQAVSALQNFSTAFFHISTFVQNNFSQEAALQIKLLNLRNKIVKRLLLLYEQQPMPIITVRKAGESSNSRNTAQSSTRTEISLRLINIFEWVQSIPGEINLNIALIPEDKAKGLEQTDGNIQFEIKTRIEALGSNRQGENPGFISVTLRRDESTDTFQTTLKNVSITGVEQRNGKKEKVSAQKYYFYVSCDLNVPTLLETLPIKAWALSSPVIVCTYSQQAVDATATASWLKHFSTTANISPELQSQAPISEIMHVLEWHFVEWTTNKSDKDCPSLTLTGLHGFAIKKMVMVDLSARLGIPVAEIENQIPLPLHEFYYGKMQGRNFSILVWLHSAATKLLNRKTSKNNYLRALFREDKIHFISKEDAKNMLWDGQNGQPLPVGYFLVRISEGALSELSVVYVHKSGTIQVSPLSLDFTSGKSIRRSFDECIYKQDAGEFVLTTLYPQEESRDEAFPRDMELVEPPRLGYVPLATTNPES